MSGKMSRRKGMRGEYLVRDALRAIGYTVDRVPASGASQGFKGDLRVRTPDARELIVEVKLRKNDFSKLYEELIYRPDNYAIYCAGAIASMNPVNIFEKRLLIASHIVTNVPLEKHIRRLFTYLKEADILAVKDDRKPTIYIEWLEDPHNTGGGNA